MKTNLRAFAVGIIFATGVMGVAYSIVSSDTLGKSEVKAYAKENDMHLLTNEEYQELLPSIEEEKPAEQSTEQKPPAAEQEKPEEEAQAEEANEPFDVNIPDGMATYEVSELLEAEGVIKDADEFDAFLEDRDIATRVRAGTFTMKKNMSYEEAAGVLIRQ
ncbi:Tfp pilus assembly protein PilP [Bacillus tianshenii]|uniref:Tfp pilus assembly protein PilP n=1 Tax=Sutcliffiella tianshenii TaxID=1463404 RepID=A0ABS2NZX6_9BACI|nr:endolytic transglycosylase MltG [Bacillus tianshenii]MBM7620238.1 Tfp pilus assembly protein PilP [Bacillus tianshenii]MCA1318964.1 endolytic transglycosylase MltG [Bacillus tianshenii]